MKMLTIAIALSGALALTACGKSNDADKPSSATAPAPMSEQSTPATGEASLTDQAMQTGKETWEKTKEVSSDAADAVATTSQEIYESSKEAAIEAGTAVSDKSAEYYDAAKETAGEMVDTTKEKSAELLDSMNKD